MDFDIGTALTTLINNSDLWTGILIAFRVGAVAVSNQKNKKHDNEEILRLRKDLQDTQKLLKAATDIVNNYNLNLQLLQAENEKDKLGNLLPPTTNNEQRENNKDTAHDND